MNGASISAILTTWWSVVRVFSFFMYSTLVCRRTWTVSTNPSKLIRSDWFSSNMYLLVLCFVVPYCSLNLQNPLFVGFDIEKFLYFMLYNVTCTVCNFLFIIILNKHRVVTRYVFYISVFMICAYVESDIVAVFYFILNSQGSLNNVKPLLFALQHLASLWLWVSVLQCTLSANLWSHRSPCLRDWERGEFNVFGLGKQHLLPSSFDISFYRFCYVVLCRFSTALWNKKHWH